MTSTHKLHCLQVQLQLSRIFNWNQLTTATCTINNASSAYNISYYLTGFVSTSVSVSPTHAAPSRTVSPATRCRRRLSSGSVLSTIASAYLKSDRDRLRIIEKANRTRMVYILIAFRFAFLATKSVSKHAWRVHGCLHINASLTLPPVGAVSETSDKIKQKWRTLAILSNQLQDEASGPERLCKNVISIYKNIHQKFRAYE